MRFHNCTGSYIFESHADWLSKSKWFFVFVCYLQPDGNRSEEIKTWTLSKSIKKEILRDDQFFIRDAQPTKKWIHYCCCFFMESGDARSEWSDRIRRWIWQPTSAAVGWYVRMSGSRSRVSPSPWPHLLSPLDCHDARMSWNKRFAGIKRQGKRTSESTTRFPYATHIYII